MKTKNIITLCFIWITTMLNAQGTNQNSNDSITDNSIQYPESMTGELGKLLRDWQIDLSSTDKNCSRGSNILFHDSVYISRLQAIPTIMELSFNSVVKRYIEMYASNRREQVGYMLALGDYYFPLFEQALDKENLPLELKYLPVIESALNPVAVSRAGATGLWQFMLRTGKGYGLEVNSLVDERMDPYKSTRAAVRYLKDLYTIYGDWNLVIAAYNCGPGNVNKAIARSGGKRDYWQIYYNLPRETRGYVPAFIAANYIMNHYADHNICPSHPSAAVSALDTVHVEERIHLNQISEVLDVPLHQLRRLNPQFKSDIIPGNSKPYALVLPSEKMYAFIDKQSEILAYRASSYNNHRANTDHFITGGSSSSSGSVENVYYRVRRGDNLSKIARRYRISLSTLKSWNGLRSNRISVGKRLVVGKRSIALASANTGRQEERQGVREQAETETINQYYRVRKGDTLNKIARRNGIQVSQLRAWNSLRSTRIGVGDRLIVKKIEVPRPQEEPARNEYTKAETTTSGSSIIADYLKEQLEKSEE